MTLEDSPRTSLERLERSKLFLQFVNADGICRLAGRLEAREGDTHLRLYGFGAGETLRFVTRGPVQLLRRPDGVRAPAVRARRAQPRPRVAGPGRGDHASRSAAAA